MGLIDRREQILQPYPHEIKYSHFFAILQIIDSQPIMQHTDNEHLIQAVEPIHWDLSLLPKIGPAPKILAV